MKSIKTKLFIIIASISLIPLLITNIYFYQNLTSTLKTNTSDSINEGLRSLSTRTTIYMQTIETYNYLILNDEELIFALNAAQTSNDHSGVYRSFREATKSFFLRSSYKNVTATGSSDCYLFQPTTNTFMDSSLTFYDHISPEQVPFYQTLKDNDYQGIWNFTPASDYQSLFDNNPKYNKNALSYLIPFSEENPEIGLLSINMQCSYFADTFQSVSKVTGGNLLVFKDDTLISSSQDIDSELSRKLLSEAHQTDQTLVPDFTYSYKSTNYLAVCNYLDAYGISFIYLLPDTIYLGNIKQIMPSIILLCFVLLIGLFGLCIYISHLFYSPIKPLLSVMEHVQNKNMDTRITEQRYDEYQKIYTGFNTMMDEVNTLIATLLTTTSLQKDAQIKLLQAQMNPHFIYNTLESIYSLAKINGEDEIATIIESLSSFYRFSLSGGASDITIEQAVSMMENYLNIQNFRFDNSISYDVSLPQNLAHVRVPKFILQAIVENAVCHGIEPITHPGHLTIEIFTEKDLVIRVADNGIGISESNLKELKKSINTPFESQLKQQETENFALRNLNQQIKLNYGDRYGLDIESTLSEGTIISVFLPAPLNDIDLRKDGLCTLY